MNGRCMFRATNLVKIIILALLVTISIVLFLLNFPLPFLPPYLKVEFAEVSIILVALIYSPAAGFIAVAIKNALYLAIVGGEPVGVVANFLASIMFVLPVAILYHKYKGIKSIVAGLVTGTII